MPGAVFTEWARSFNGVATYADKPVCFALGNDLSTAYKTIHAGTCASGTSTTQFTLENTASAVASYYIGMRIRFTNDSPAGLLNMERIITGYTAGRLVTVATALPVQPDATSTYAIVEQISGHASVVAGAYPAPRGGLLYTNSSLTGTCDTISARAGTGEVQITDTGHTCYSATGPVGAIAAKAGTGEIQITDVAHGLFSGWYVSFLGVTGDQAATLNANRFRVTVIDADNFYLQGTTHSGVSANGTWYRPAYVKFSGVTGDLATTLNDKTHEAIPLDADNFYLHSTTHSGSSSGGTWAQVGYLLYGSPTHGESGPFNNADPGEAGCILLDGATGGIDFGGSAEGEPGLLSAVVADTVATLVGGIWFKIPAFEVDGSMQLLHIPYTAAKAIIDLRLARSTNHLLTMTAHPSATGSQTSFSQTLSAGTWADANQWCYAQFYITSVVSATGGTNEMAVYYYSPSQPNGVETATSAAYTSQAAFVDGVSANQKSSVGYFYNNATPTFFTSGYLAGFWLVGAAHNTQLTNYKSGIDLLARGAQIYQMGVGNIPNRPAPAMLKTLFSLPNLRI